MQPLNCNLKSRDLPRLNLRVGIEELGKEEKEQLSCNICMNNGVKVNSR